MSAKGQKSEPFAEKRARALAVMLLTEREDLLVEEPTGDLGLDFIVRFHTPGRPGLREFGIQLKATRTPAAKVQADALLRHPVRDSAGYGPFPYPVCLFYFTMEDNGAWYTWVVEPAESDEGKPVLRLRGEADCRPLDKKALKEVIAQVDSWYEAVYPSLVVNGSGRSKAGHSGAKP